MPAAAVAIFFDLGDTLVIPRFGPAGTLDALDPLPFVLKALDKLRKDDARVRLGVMSNTPAEATAASMGALLKKARLLPRFDPSLLVYSSVEGVSKSDPAFFRRGATKAALAASQCVFVGEDAAERAVARQAGFNVAFHPLHAFHVLEQIG